MGRKNKDIDLATGIAQLVLIVLVLGMLHPTTRKIIAGMGQLVMVLLVLLLVGFAGVCVYFLVARRRRAKAANDSTEESNSNSDPAEKQPRTLNSVMGQLRKADWHQFERVMGVVYAKRGYQVEQRGGANPDGGIDLVLEKEGTRLAVQCKHWKTWKVGVKTVREFLGAMTDAGINQGIVATMSECTGEARELAAKHGIELLTEGELEKLLATSGAWEDERISEILEDPAKRCPKCGREMVLRTASKGANAGSKFWGCSGYPQCRQTMQTTGNGEGW